MVGFFVRRSSGGLLRQAHEWWPLSSGDQVVGSFVSHFIMMSHDWDRSGVDVGLICCRRGVDLGSIWGLFGVYLGSGQSGSGQIGSGQITSGYIGSGQIGSGQILCTPLRQTTSSPTRRLSAGAGTISPRLTMTR